MAYFKESTIKQNLFPIGYVMITVTNTNPSLQFGGTWVNIGSGKTLVGVDTEDSDFNTVEKTGGSKTKTLITDNLPAHNHTASSSSSTTTTGTFANHTHTHSHTHARGSLRIYGGGIRLPFDSPSSSTNGPYYSAIDGKYGGMNSGTSHGWGTLSFDTNKSGTTWAGATADASTTTTSGASGDISATSTTTTTTTIDNTGSGTAFDVKNPYLTVYFWKKTA